MAGRGLKIITIFVLFANVGFAQNIKLSGKIVDDDHVFLPLARMQLIVAGDTMMHHVTTSDGTFSFSFAPLSRVQLITSHVGFETDVREFVLKNDTTLNIVLTFSSLELGEAVVTARSRALIRSSDFGVISLSGERLSNIPSIMGTPDINRILQLMPGVQHAGEANGHLYVRGADPGHNLMLYNNVPVYGTSHLFGLFPFFNVDHVDRIRFDKSGREAQFGNRLGATVQCLSPNEIPENFSIKGNVGLLASQATISTPLGENVGLIVSARQTYVDEIIGQIIDNSDENSIDDFGYSFTDANFTLIFRPNEKHSIAINAFLSGDRFTIRDNQMLVDMHMRWGNQLASINWNYRLNSTVNINTDVYFSRYFNLLQIGQADLDLQIDSDLLDFGFNSSIDFELFSMPFSAGIQYANYRVRPQGLFSETLPTPMKNNTINSQFISTFLQSEISVTEKISLDAGIRFGFYGTDDNTTNDFQFEPRIGLNFTDEKWSAYLSYARKSQRLHLITTSSVGFPTDFWIAASEGIPVSTADNFSMGSIFRVLPRVELTVGAFYSRMNNLVHYPFNVLQFNQMTTFANDLYVGKGRARGLEFMLTKTGRLSGWISYTLSRSDRQFDEIDNGQRFPSKFDRRHDFSAVATYRIAERWTAGITQVFASGSRFTTPTSWYFINNNPVKQYGRHNNATIPSYIRTDISVDFTINRTERTENTLSFSIYNVFAVRNPVYVILDIRASETGNVVEVFPRYRTMYTILPSISWRFRF
ncbi:MAG: TonB-dependent receptor [Bacteroidales bacterium]|nr:TonB-dependent receptor [Bacteroidales bacterium]